MSRVLLVLTLAAGSGGCASLTNPVADGTPVNRVPPEMLGRPKADLRPIPFTLLRQQAPDPYLLDTGDILAVVANEVIAPGDLPPPVRPSEVVGQPPVVGYPVPVREDGTVSIPLLPAITARGRTVKQVEQDILNAVTGKSGGPVLVKPAAARVSVQLEQRRRVQVLVVRQDTAGGGSIGPAVQGSLGAGPGGGANPFTASTGVGTGGKRGQGFTINLPAGENDVLRALNATGGLPGLDAKNEVVVIRGGKNYCDAVDQAGRTVRIPLRVYPDQPITVREDDIVLHDGDVVSIEARDSEVFYTAGLVGTTVYPLPRDVDLNIIQAIAVIRGPLANGSFSQSAFSSSAVNSGIGAPNASLCSVLRQTPDGRQLEIRVDLNKALRNPRERILVQPGDIVVIQERPSEAITRYLTSTFRFSGFLDVLTRPSGSIGLSATVP